MEKKKKGFSLTSVLLVLLLILCVVFIFTDTGKSGEEISVNEAYVLMQEDKIECVYASGSVVKIKVRENSKVDAKDFPSDADFYFETQEGVVVAFIEDVKEYNADETNSANTIDWQYPPAKASVLDFLMPVLYLGLGLILVFVVIKMLTGSNKSTINFGKSRAKAVSNIKVRFTDIAGAEEEKRELAEIVEFLKNPQKFTDMGAKIPKGVLLVGPPGTGKTLLARAVAGESNVPFLSISGSDFVEMFVGVGASRVRDLFETAKKHMPCIVFIDEIDAVGRQRGTGLGGGNDEREQTLNQLLVEMDGFEHNDGIIVLAATNRADVLDPALLRPGRFDRQVYVHLPDVRGREGIIKIHARNKPIDSEVDFQTLARITSGFTGADIENMLNEAAILAARAGRPKILMTDLTEGINKVIMGPQKKSLLVTDNDKKITAYHESGHAIIAKKLKHCEEVQEVSIIARGMAAGYTMSRPTNDDNHMTYNKLNDTIAMIMGGRIAEELMIKDISTGASNDIERATEIARKMVTEWGMSKNLGFASYSSSGKSFIGRDYLNKVEYSEQTAAEIDKEIREILAYNYSRAKKILAENKALLEEMTAVLLEQETIYKEEVDMLVAGMKKDEVVEHLKKQEEKRKKKEEFARVEQEAYKKVKEIELKVRTGEMYLKNGIITQKDFEILLKEKERLIREFEETQKQLKDKSEVEEESEKVVAKDEEKPKRRVKSEKQEKTVDLEEKEKTKKQTKAPKKKSEDTTKGEKD